MPTVTAERAEEIVVGWRTADLPVDGWDNPAGPLFPGSDFAESEITMTGGGTRCSGCSASYTRVCC
jgi:hypothetical protein